LLALGVAIAVHATIIAHVRRRLTLLDGAARPSHAGVSTSRRFAAE
jgi:hypothetical protein